MTACVKCQTPLRKFVEHYKDDEDNSLTIGPSANTGSSVDDDVQLQCGCHFHWQCLLEAYSTTECPHCERDLLSTAAVGEQQLLCNFKDERGLQEGLDILPILAEEIHVKTYWGEERCLAFLEFCAKGDVDAIADSLINDNEDDEEQYDGKGLKPYREDVLRYQDPIGEKGSALHVAIQNEREEVAWLLLLLASNLSIESFPSEVMQAAQMLGLAREDQNGKRDIRMLEDKIGQNAEQLAFSIGGVWRRWLNNGWLKPPE